jgi:hypothetical protein
MSPGGFYLIARGWLDHPALGGKREPFCRRAAWAWLIEEAAWRDRRTSVAGKTVLVGRGQLTHSLRFMGRAWGWSEPSVRRFLARLEDDGMIVCGKSSDSRPSDDRSKTDAHSDARRDAGQLLITICNYDVYQAPVAEPDAGTDAPSDAQATQERRRSDADEKEVKEVNEGKEERAHELTGSPESDPIKVAFREWWNQFPPKHRAARPKVLAKYRAIVKSKAATPDELLAKVMAYGMSDEVARGYECAPFKWLDEGRWQLDFAPATSANGAGRPNDTGRTLADAGADMLNHTSRAEAARRAVKMEFDRE